MALKDKKFGDTVRDLRKAKGMGLREFAKKVDMSPTYLSKVERNEFRPPAEEKVVAIAEALDQDPDELLGLAGRVPSDLAEIVRSRPREMAAFLRTAKSLTTQEIEKLTQQAGRRKKRSKR